LPTLYVETFRLINIEDITSTKCQPMRFASAFVPAVGLRFPQEINQQGMSLLLGFAALDMPQYRSYKAMVAFCRARIPAQIPNPQMG
jgi:hypothetical protein